MKKWIGVIVAFFSLTVTATAANGKVILNVYGNCLSLAANDFTGQDSQFKAFLEAKAAFRVSGNLYVWASHGYFPMHDSWTGWDQKSSFDKDIRVDRTLGKRVIAGGCGFFMGYLEQSQMAVRVEAGICSISNAIDSTVRSIDTLKLVRNSEARQAGIGARGSLAFTYGLYRNVFAEASLGYMYAADTIDGVRSSLGGFHLSLGLGIVL